MGIKVELDGDRGVTVVAADIAEFIQAFSENLSTEGVLLTTDLRPPRGRELQLSMRLEDGFELVKAVGMVAWQRGLREGSSIASGVALHLLTIESGRDFLERLVREHEAAGGVAFSAERSAPMTTDGSPPPADALDQMMARRGDRSATAELKDVAPPPPTPDEPGPEFAPGFGKADLWNSEVAAEMPGQVNDWLGDEQRGVDRAASARAGKEDEGAESPSPDPTASTSGEVSSGDAGASVSGSSEPPLPAKPKRTGPIKMKLAADRQPKPAASSSFVQASRRATELMSETTAVPKPAGTAGPAKPTAVEAPSEPPPGLSNQPIGGGTEAALATVAIKPGDLAKIVDQASQVATHAASAEGAPAAEGISSADGSAVVVTTAPAVNETNDAALKPTEAAAAVAGPESSQSQLSMDLDALRETATKAGAAGFGVPEEDRRPMLVVGIIVGLIAVGMIIWTLVL